MTAAEPHHARSGRLRRAWSGFRHWRWTRPFWGGLLTALAGLEIFGTTQMSLAALSFQTGPTGFLSWLIPAILVTCGLLMWFKPQHRMLYAVVAAVTTLFSLIAVNLGGFLVGLILGLVGSALAAGWVPAPHPTSVPAERPAGDGTTYVTNGARAEPDGSPGHRAVPSESPDEATVRNEPRAGVEPDLPAAGPGRGRSGTSRPSSTS